MDTGSKDISNEPWHRQEGENAYQYEAFKCFRSLPAKDRTMIGAYRLFSGNRNAKLNARFRQMADDFSWVMRSLAYDAYLDRIREEAYEEAAREEATRVGLERESMQSRLFEMSTAAYGAVMEFFENFDTSEMSMRDATNIMKIHLDFARDNKVEEKTEKVDLWTEADDDNFANRAMDDLDAASETGSVVPDDEGREEEGV